MPKLRPSRLAVAAAAVGLLAPLVGGVSASATTHAWNDGFQDQDSILDCYGNLSTGLSANVSWSSPTGKVPKVGEVFYLRGYAGLVSLPCSGRVKVLPEILVPAGVEFVDEPVVWDHTPAGQPQELTTDPLLYLNGSHGGYIIANADDTPFSLRQGDVLEFQFPVRATRELKGPATRQPQCQERLDGVAPCKISESGDHFQVGFQTAGYGGSKTYVTPFVGLFAEAVAPQPGPGLPTPTAPGQPAPTPGVPTPTPGQPTPTPGQPTPTPGQPGQPGQPGPEAGKAPSRTKAVWKGVPGRNGSVRVTVSSSTRPSGVVAVKDGRRTIAAARLRPAQKGRTTVAVPRLKKGKHVLTVSYRGSSEVAASTSARRTVRVR
jgi:hypothetical protein